MQRAVLLGVLVFAVAVGFVGWSLLAPTTTSDPPAVGSTATPLPAPGVVRLCVRDGASGLPIAGATVRFLGQGRFAEASSDEEGWVRCRLTPGEYRVGVHLDAYEHGAAGPLVVASAEEQEFAPVHLWPGSSHLDGRLVAGRVRRDQPYLVELRGVGRNPCAECRTPSGEQPPKDAGEPAAAERPSLVPASTCPECGHDAEVSTLEVWPGGFFGFRNLTSGRYRLSARRDRDSAVDAEEVLDIEPRQRKVVHLDPREGTDVVFELRDADGQPFDGNWWEIPNPDEAEQGAVPQLRAARVRYRFHALERQVASARVALPSATPAALGPRRRCPSPCSVIR